MALTYQINWIFCIYLLCSSASEPVCHWWGQLLFTSNCIEYSISNLMSLSLSSSVFPQQWKSETIFQTLNTTLSDDVYTWIHLFFQEQHVFQHVFQDHAHCTRKRLVNFPHHFSCHYPGIRYRTSPPTPCVLTASDLQSLLATLWLIMQMTHYLVVPTTNARSCAAEVDHIEIWTIFTGTRQNNLKLRRQMKSQCFVLIPTNV